MQLGAAPAPVQVGEVARELRGVRLVDAGGLWWALVLVSMAMGWLLDAIIFAKLSSDRAPCSGGQALDIVVYRVFPRLLLGSYRFGHRLFPLSFLRSASGVSTITRTGCNSKRLQNGQLTENRQAQTELTRNELSVKAEWEEDAAEFLFRTPRGHVGLSRG